MKSPELCNVDEDRQVAESGNQIYRNVTVTSETKVCGNIQREGRLWETMRPWSASDCAIRCCCIYSSVHTLTMSCRAFIDGERYALSTWQRVPPKGKKKELPLHKAPMLIPPSNHKGRNVDSMFFPLKCNSSPPFFCASYYRWIILLVWTIAGRIGPASSAKSILHALPAGIFFFNLHALKNNPKLLITAALFAPFGWLLSTLCLLAVRLA